jgi:outer membrane receptor protein involved in Fe transport
LASCRSSWPDSTGLRPGAEIGTGSARKRWPSERTELRRQCRRVLSFRYGVAIRIGASARHVGDRFNYQDDWVTMNQYTLFDACAFVDVPKTIFNSIDKTRITFGVKNLTNKLYARWGDPG